MSGRKPAFALERDGDRWYLISRTEIEPFEKMAFDVRALRPMLTPTEEKVLAMLVDMKVNKEIADALGCTVRTVKFHVSALLRKTGCVSRFEIYQRFGGRADPGDG